MAFIGLSGWMAAERTSEQMLQRVGEKAAGVTAQTSVQIIDAVSAGNSLAAMLSGSMGSGPMRKADAVAGLRTVLERYPNVFGTGISDTIDKRSERSLTDRQLGMR